MKPERQQLHLKMLGCLLLCFLFSQRVFAHDSVTDLENMSKTDAAVLYLQLGYQHILPLGLDHILFVLSLFLLNPQLKPVLWQATAFTVAHTVTLGLSMYKIIKPPSSIVEPLIALSILYVALENIFSNKLKATRIGVVFLFGLIHGMGFASALGQLGLPKNAYFTSLLMFNLGVELGQITVILAAYLLLGRWFGKKPYYRRYIVIPLSTIICVVAAFWLVQRIFFTAAP
ncbi:HupE/UreJ family protein [Ferruginibacter sp.]